VNAFSFHKGSHKQNAGETLLFYIQTFQILSKSKYHGTAPNLVLWYQWFGLIIISLGLPIALRRVHVCFSGVLYGHTIFYAAVVHSNPDNPLPNNQKLIAFMPLVSMCVCPYTET
jgi:hypothetical protein